MVRFFAVAERDIRKFIRNPMVIMVSILMPILYLVILGNSFQGELKNLPLAVVKMDIGPYGQRIMDNLHSLEAGPSTITIYHVENSRFAIEGLKNGIFKAALIIPEDFSKNILHKKTSEVGLFLDNSEPVSSEAIRGAIGFSFAAIGQEFVSIREERVKSLIREIEIYKKIDYDQTLIPGVVIMAIFLGAMTTGVFNIVMDKFLGIEESYLLTPITKIDIVGGLIASGLLVTTILAIFVFFVTSIISGVYLWKILTFESFFLITLVIMLSTLSLQGLMFVILGRADHPRIVGVLGGFLNVILFFPSGAIYPVESFPKWLKVFSDLNPETYSVHALKTLLFKGATIAGIKEDIIFLSIFAPLMVFIAILTFKREL